MSSEEILNTACKVIFFAFLCFFNEERSWSSMLILFSSIWLWEFSINSMNEKQKSFSLLMLLSLLSRLFSTLIEFSAVIRWISYDAEFQQYLHSQLWYLQSFEFETKIQFFNLSWMTCFISHALRSSCIFRQYYSKLMTLNWSMSCLLIMIDKSWCKTCQWQSLQKIIAREFYKQEDSENDCLFYRRAQDELYVMTHQSLLTQRYIQSHWESHHLCAVSLKLRKLSLNYTQLSRIAQSSLISFFSSLFSCRSIHVLYFLKWCAFEDFYCSSQLNLRQSSWIKLHRTSCRTSRKTLDKAQIMWILFSKANHQWFINSSWLSIDTTETISSWVEKFSMQITRMKNVQQNDTERHRKMSSLQQSSLDSDNAVQSICIFS